MRTVVILGAGCSAGLAELPADKDFLSRYLQPKGRPGQFDELYFLFEAWEILYGYGRCGYTGTVGDVRLETFWSEIDENFNSAKIVLHSKKIDEWFHVLNNLAKLEEKKEYKYYWHYLYEDPAKLSPYEYFFMFAGWQLRKAVAECYGKICDTKVKTIYGSLISCVNEMAKGEDPIYISFNYDTFLEQSLPSYHYLGLNDCNYKEGCINIVKPHGSVNWHHIVGESIVAEKEPMSASFFGFDNKHRLHQNSIVGLVSNKIEFDKGKQQDPIVLSLYANRLLPLVTSTIKDAERLVIVGYSFPLTDVHVWQALKSANTEHLKGIVIVDKGKDESNIDMIFTKLSQLFFSHTYKGSQERHFWNDGVESWLKHTSKTSKVHMQVKVTGDVSE